MNIKKYTQKDRYGNMFSYEFDVPSMQEIPNYVDNDPAAMNMQNPLSKANMQGVDNSIFKPKGTDTVPAMLTPGENVVNAEASRLPGVQDMLDMLNDKGRAIQKEQGGPIPSYNSEGGQIDYYGNDYNQSTVNSEISTLKGMGLSDSQIIQALMNNLNMSQGEAQAALMPAYKQDGGIIVDDAMLDAIKQVESGGDPNALSGVGAGGQYQIMPKTAQQPGYGTTPISLEDRFDPEKSRAFAKQYLQGIIKQHPEFTKDQVLTAYHSGAGNVLKDNIGPVGQAYAGKVNSEIGDVPTTDIITFDGREQEPGFMSAQASTDNLSGYPGYIPKPEDPALPNVDTMDQGFVDKRDEEIFDFKSFKLNSQLGQERFKKDQLESLKNRLKKKRADGFEVNSNDLNQLKKLEDEIKRVESNIFKTQNEIDEENKESIKRSEEARIRLGIPKSKEIDINKEAEEKKKAAQDLIDQTDGLDTALNDAEIYANTQNTSLVDGFINKAKEIGGPIVDKSIEYFKNAFSSMFNGEELARMAMVYAGSRALGYNHGGSLNYSMKNYIKRVDANLAAARKFSLTDKAREDYTEASLKQYAKTGDRDDLIPKKANVSATGFKGELFHRDFGKLQIIERSNKIDGVRIPANVARDLQRQGKIPANADVSSGFDVGINSPLIKGKTAKLNPSFHDATTMRKDFAVVAKSNLDAVNAIEKGSEMKKIQESSTEISNEAQKLLTKGLKHFQILDDNTAAMYRREVDSSISDYYKALRIYYNNKENGVDDEDNPKPTGIAPYFNKRILPLKTKSIIQPQDIAKTSPENLLELEKLILRESGTKDPRRYMDIWEGAREQWLSMKSYGSYSEDLADEGWDGFTLWLFDMNQPKPKEDATKLLEKSNLK